MANKYKTESNYELDKNVTAIFDVRKTLGKGAYGIVWKAVDKRQRDTVALKKIYDAFRDTTDAQRTYREVVFLRAFRHHPNIIRLLGIYRATNNMDFYLVFEHMESDLHIVIKKRDILKDIHRQFVMYQLVNAIKYVHSGNVIHRDLKPSNILIDSKCRLKVADFGLARTLPVKPSEGGTGDATGLHDAPSENDGMMSDYVATRWYRAPEILVGCRRYTKAVDMWSLGCILGEMITEQPIFQGSSTINQMEKILSALPNVTQREIDDIGTRFGTSLLCRSIVRDYQQSLSAMCRGCTSNEIAFTTSLLMLDPNDRITANKALKHPFVSSFRCPSAEMEMRLNVQPPLRDDYRFALDDYRNNLYRMISKELGTGRRSTQSCRTPTTTTVPRDSAALRELPFGCRTSALSSMRKPCALAPNTPRNNQNRICAEPQQKYTNACCKVQQLYSNSQSHPHFLGQAKAHAQSMEELPRRPHYHKHSSHFGFKGHTHSPPIPPQRVDGERAQHKGHRSHVPAAQRELREHERPVVVTTPRVVAQPKVKERVKERVRERERVREKEKILSQSQARAYVETEATGKHKPQVLELSTHDWVEMLNPTTLAGSQDAREPRGEAGHLKPPKARISKQKPREQPKTVQTSVQHELEAIVVQKEPQGIVDHNQNPNPDPDPDPDPNPNPNLSQRKVRKREKELLQALPGRRTDNTTNERSFLLEALLRRKQRETNSQDPDMDAKVQANLDKLEAARNKMQKKILKYAAETGLMYINENSKNNGSDRSTPVYSTDSETYFTPKSRKTVVKKTLLEKYQGNRDVKHHGNNITELHESTLSHKFKKQQQQEQQHDVFDASEKDEQQVGDVQDFLEAKYCLTQELLRHEMEKARYDSIIPSGVRQSPDDSFNTRPTPGKQHTVLKPMYFDSRSTPAPAPAPAQTLPRRRKHITGDNFQPLHQRHISEIQAARINDD
ncbi:extracellular signal-regulated kinase 7 isoform X2 [Drosophila miranda]|uniref:extracellular signal-regulated kinase 7 isoform X2 n=1 Tax=Drosophila miranda TaxID=7229 RepID=UPI0007E7D329|nr:extracellular signal-regulated kinase 7 isoform X2 [Drosophila miranda]